MISQRLYYPFLFVLFFVLFVFYENRGEVYLHQLLRPAVLLVFLTACCVFVGGWVLRSYHKAAFATAVVLSVVFLHRAVVSLVSPDGGGAPFMFLLLETLVVVGALIHGLFVRRNWASLNKALNLMGFALVGMTSVQVLVYAMQDDGYIIEPEFVAGNTGVDSEEYVGEYRPDVYYILTDAYARADSLSDFFGYDNSKFLQSLESKGFLIADQSLGNYPSTRFVVNSMFNMDYVGDKDGMMVLPDGSRLRPTGRIEDNVVSQIFYSLGYRIVTIRSTGHYINISGADDYTHKQSWWRPSDDFESALVETTILPSFLNLLTADFFSRRQSVDFAFAELSRQIAKPGPKLVVTHLMVPHEPFVYAHDGSHTEGDGPSISRLAELPETVRAYRDQVHHLNSLLEKTVTEILAKSSTPPIIVLQGDHGLRVTRYSTGIPGQATEALNWTCPREILANLNAMYLPGDVAAKEFYPSISPVNTFRLIVDGYFGGDYGFVPDRAFRTVYADAHHKDVETFIDITAEAENCSDDWQQAFREAQ